VLAHKCACSITNIDHKGPADESRTPEARINMSASTVQYSMQVCKQVRTATAELDTGFQNDRLRTYPVPDFDR
jgi:hypothetical protein